MMRFAAICYKVKDAPDFDAFPRRLFGSYQRSLMGLPSLSCTFL